MELGPLWQVHTHAHTQARTHTPENFLLSWVWVTLQVRVRSIPLQHSTRLTYIHCTHTIPHTTPHHTTPHHTTPHYTTPHYHTHHTTPHHCTGYKQCTHTGGTQQSMLPLRGTSARGLVKELCLLIRSELEVTATGRSMSTL